MRFLLAAVTTATIVAFSGTGVRACVMAPPAPPEVVAARTLRWQADLWARSPSVFLVRTERPGRAGNINLSATLVPVLQLKGDAPHGDLRVHHSAMTSCGPSPFLDALNGERGQFFVAFSSDPTPTGASIQTTIRLSDLIEPMTIAAWRAAYAPE